MEYSLHNRCALQVGCYNVTSLIRTEDDLSVIDEIAEERRRENRIEGEVDQR